MRNLNIFNCLFIILTMCNSAHAFWGSETGIANSLNGAKNYPDLIPDSIDEIENFEDVIDDWDLINNNQSEISKIALANPDNNIASSAENQNIDAAKQSVDNVNEQAANSKQSWFKNILNPIGAGSIYVYNKSKTVTGSVLAGVKHGGIATLETLGSGVANGVFQILQSKGVKDFAAAVVDNAQGQLDKTVELATAKASEKIEKTSENLAKQAKETTEVLLKKIEESNDKILDRATELKDDLFNDYKKGLALTTAGALASIISWHGFKTMSEEYTKPKLIVETSDSGYYSKIKGFFGGHKDKEIMHPLFVPDEIKNELTDVLAQVKLIRQNGGSVDGESYSNLLLSGAPGTGKTHFAKSIAYESGMDYAILSGSVLKSLLISGGAADALNDLFNWGARSKNGLLIFIDEAESFLAERNWNKDDDRRIDLVNQFLSRTGDLSKKVMFVLATNNASILDSTLDDRIGIRINLPLPNKIDRERILRFFINSTMKNKLPEFISSAQEVLTNNRLKYLANETEGLSGRKLEQLINSINSISAIHGGKVTEEIVDLALKRIKATLKPKASLQVAQTAKASN